MAEINSFLCYRSYLEAADMLPEDKRWTFFRAVMIYALDGVDPDFTEYDMKLAFTLMKANIDSCNKRYSASVENGKKGGRPPKNDSEKKPRKNPAKPSNNLNKDDNVNDNPYIGVSVEGDLSSPPPPLKRNERIMLNGIEHEYYITEEGERRVRAVDPK